MIFTKLTALIEKSAGRTLTLRGAIVAVNFVVMMGLAAGLGLDVFGRLVFSWGAALVAGTVLSFGGPLILLRGLTDGRGMRRWDVTIVILVLPAALAVLAFGLLTAHWSPLPWFAILATGFAINALTCIASVMRALGSVQLSMALRDMGPSVALGIGAVAVRTGPVDLILIVTAALIAIICLAAIIWCCIFGPQTDIFSDQKRQICDLSLWGTSVLGMVVTQMDLIVGGAVLTGDALGAYAVLRRVANLVALPVTVATWVSAAPISAAHGRGNMQALQRASAAGSQVALLPGMMLFLVGLAALPIVMMFVPDAAATFMVLLIGALIQVIFASGYTVATLCGHAYFAAVSRLMALVFYMFCAHLIGAQLSPISNALAFTVAMSGSSLLLWALLKRKTGIETSAFALWRSGVLLWKTP